MSIISIDGISTSLYNSTKIRNQPSKKQPQSTQFNISFQQDSPQPLLIINFWYQSLNYKGIHASESSQKPAAISLACIR